MELKLIDDVVKEPLGARTVTRETNQSVKAMLKKYWNQLQGTDPKRLSSGVMKKSGDWAYFEELAATRVVTKVLERKRHEKKFQVSSELSKVQPASLEVLELLKPLSLDKRSF